MLHKQYQLVCLSKSCVRTGGHLCRNQQKEASNEAKVGIARQKADGMPSGQGVKVERQTAKDKGKDTKGNGLS